MGGEEPLEKGIATHSSILAWRIPWTEEPGVTQTLQSMALKGVLGMNTVFMELEFGSFPTLDE